MKWKQNHNKQRHSRMFRNRPLSFIPGSSPVTEHTWDELRGRHSTNNMKTDPTLPPHLASIPCVVANLPGSMLRPWQPVGVEVSLGYKALILESRERKDSFFFFPSAITSFSNTHRDVELSFGLYNREGSGVTRQRTLFQMDKSQMMMILCLDKSFKLFKVHSQDQIKAW